jgi:hypothetical protein
MDVSKVVVEEVSSSRLRTCWRISEYICAEELFELPLVSLLEVKSVYMLCQTGCAQSLDDVGSDFYGSPASVCIQPYTCRWWLLHVIGLI